MMDGQFTHQKRAFRAICLQWTPDKTDAILAVLNNPAESRTAELYRNDYIMIRDNSVAGLHTLHRGNWVFKGEDGELRIYTDERFNINYEAIEAA